MDYGETFQFIRKGKNFTLKEAAGEILSVSQLSRFENNRSMIPADLLEPLLQNINTTPQEFYFLLRKDSEKELRVFFLDLIRYLDQDDYGSLKKMKKEMETFASTASNWQKYLLYFLDSILHIVEGKAQSRKLPIQHYLMQVEDWGEMELRIYALFGFIFEVETTYRLMKTALKKSKLYRSIPQTGELLYTILINCFSTYLFYDRIDYAEETLRLFEEEHSTDLDLLSPHLNFLFSKGILAYKKQDPQTGQAYCEKAIRLSRQFKQQTQEKIFIKRYKQWRESYQDPKFRELTIEPGVFGL